MFTHLVKLQKRHQYLGIVREQFRTTADAVEIHRTALEFRQRAGEVVEFEIVAI